MATKAKGSANYGSPCRFNHTCNTAIKHHCIYSLFNLYTVGHTSHKHWKKLILDVWKLQFHFSAVCGPKFTKLSTCVIITLSLSDTYLEMGRDSDWSMSVYMTKQTHSGHEQHLDIMNEMIVDEYDIIQDLQRKNKRQHHGQQRHWERTQTIIETVHKFCCFASFANNRTHRQKNINVAKVVTLQIIVYTGKHNH